MHGLEMGENYHKSAVLMVCSTVPMPGTPAKGGLVLDESP